MRTALMFAVVVSGASLSACAQQMATRSADLIDQASLCKVGVWRNEDVAGGCRPGQKIGFLPKTLRNEQLAVNFAAVNCDLRSSVALTTGAVTCIYGPITPARPNDAEATSAAQRFAVVYLTRGA